MHQALVVCHRWLALITTVVVLVVATTGAALVFEGAMDRALHPGLWHVDPGRRAAVDRLVVGARPQRSPDARVMFLTLPPKSDQPFVAAMRFPEDHTPGGRSRVFVRPV